MHFVILPAGTNCKDKYLFMIHTYMRNSLTKLTWREELLWKSAAWLPSCCIFITHILLPFTVGQYIQHRLVPMINYHTNTMLMVHNINTVLWSLIQCNIKIAYWSGNATDQT